MLVLMSGAEQAAGPVQAALERMGATVVRADSGSGSGSGPGSDSGSGRKVDAYVQLPTLLSVEGQSSADSLVERVGRFLADGLLTRFRSAAAVLPQLSEDATVVLVAGNTPVPGTGVDDQAARSSMLRVLAHALRAEEAPRRLRVRVLEHGSSPDAIARCAAGEDVVKPSSSASGPPAGSSDVDMSYADWRTEVLGLAHAEF
ncbi:MAG: hypothetical protein QOJ32_3112 [Frankiaceae bacterium]|jgi:hypothetical protein|nr:hypothetical protein [Frankiaceae bacterium]